MTDLHILLDPVKDFWKCPKKGLHILFGHFLSDPQKLNLNILNIAWWSIGTNNVFVDTQNFFLNPPKKRGFRGSLTIDQSNVNGFSWIFLLLIIKINYPHISGGPKGPLSPLHKLEVGGRRPPYLLVYYTEPILGFY